MSEILGLARDLVARLEQMPGVHESHYAAMKAFLSDESNVATEGEIAEARDVFGDDAVRIDDDALASRAGEGVWIQGWVYLSDVP